MDNREIVETFELLMIEFEYTISDLRFAQEELAAIGDRDVFQQASAQVAAARKALNAAAELIGSATKRSQLLQVS